MKKLNLNKTYKHAEVLNKAQMKKILGGTEPSDDDEGLCRECLSDSQCDGGRICYRVDNKFCSDGKEKTRCILPMAE